MKRVLITGASAGIGKATALRLAQPQRVLVLVARSEEGLKQVSQEIKKSCPSCVVEVHPLDLTDKIESRKFYESLAPLDGAVLNAGSGSAGTFLDQNNEQIASMINLNCLALTESCRYVGSAMKKNGGGRLVLISSMAAYLPVPYLSVYCATKAFVLSLGESLHQELKNDGIHVTTVCPGGVLTEFHQKAGLSDGLVEKFKSTLLTPEAVAAAIQEGFEGEKSIVVPGFLNLFSKWIIRWVPRKVLIRQAGQVYSKFIGQRPV